MTEGIRFIQVVAAVITDARGRILLSRRKEDSDVAGLWEFPGGKIEPGESAEQALIRELREEIGIDAVVGEKLIKVPQHYPSKRLTLDVRYVSAFSGNARGQEGQALMWVDPEKLSAYSMPNADIPVVAALTQPSSYAITLDMPEPYDAISIERWIVRAQTLVEKGHRRIQLRSPQVPHDVFAIAVTSLLERVVGEDVEFLVNRDIALAQQLGIGVHMNSAQLHQLDARPALFENALVAASCHNHADLERAQTLGCDFAVLSPVKETRSHPGARPIGWEGFAALRENVALPIYALGGLSMLDLEDARDHGAQGIAAIRSFGDRD